MDRELVRIERRELLAASAAALTLSAGCFGDDSDDDSNTPDDSDGEFGYGGVPLDSGDRESSGMNDGEDVRPEEATDPDKGSNGSGDSTTISTDEDTDSNPDNGEATGNQVIEDEPDGVSSQNDGEQDSEHSNPVYGVQNYGEYGYGGVIA